MAAAPSMECARKVQVQFPDLEKEKGCALLWFVPSYSQEDIHVMGL